MTNSHAPRDLEAEVLLWIARLPLTPLDDLARLTGEPSGPVRRALDALHRHGWTERLEVRAPEHDAPVPAYALREMAIPAFAVAFGLDEAEVRRHWPVGNRDLLDRVATFDVANGVNHALAQIATECRKVDKVDVLDLRARPRRTLDRWWAPGIEAYGRLGVGWTCTDFFLAWDRGNTPSQQRRARVRSWYEAGMLTDHRRSRLLIVCPSLEEEKAWFETICAEAERRAEAAASSDDPEESDTFGGYSGEFELPFVGAIDPRAAHGEHSLGRWRLLGDTFEEDLFTVLGAGADQVPFAEPSAPRLDLIDRGVDSRGASLREWAEELASSGVGSVRDRTTAHLLTLQPAHRQTLLHLARHPYLTDDQIASTLGQEPERADLVLAELVRRGLTGTQEREVE